MISNALAESVDNEVRQLYEWYQAAENDAERRNIVLEMGKLPMPPRRNLHGTRVRVSTSIFRELDRLRRRSRGNV